jgi:hypothetical protein
LTIISVSNTTATQTRLSSRSGKLADPEPLVVLVSGLAGLDQIEQQRFVDVTLRHSLLGVLGNQDRAAESRTVHGIPGFHDPAHEIQNSS